MSLIVRSAPLRRTSRTLLKCLSKKNFERLIYRTYFVGRNDGKVSSSPLKKSSTVSYGRDLNFALLGGGVLVLTYSYFSSKSVVSLDTVKGLRYYSNGANGENFVPNAGTSKEESSQNGSRGDSIVLLTEQQINAKLRDREKSFIVNRGKGIVRYDVSQLPSNHPIEDNHVEQVITVPVSGETDRQEELYFFGIFDGHSGSFTSAKLSQELVPYVARKLGQFYREGTDALASSSKMDEALIQTFEQLDNDIVYGSLEKLLRDPTKDNMVGCLPAISGSCALLTAYNSFDSTVKVAVSGDSRALIAGVDSKGQWVVKSLSTDQTGDNPDEVRRIRSEHPGEPNVVRNGRILGSLQPSRAFGDCRYKVGEVDGQSLANLPDHLRIYFRSKPRHFLTPPYVTARPEITTTKIEPNTKFMVLGSDGLFELLTNEEIAGLVISWLQCNGTPDTTTTASKTKLPHVTDLSAHKEFLRPAFRYQSTKENSEGYLMEDKNVATHLIRNALSAGGSKEYVSTLVSIPSPMSRKYRDDLTVTVVFFGDKTDKTQTIKGTIEPNLEATTMPKPKL
ncbi:hypothetical protein HG537_0B02530 [Torulaspora globosa]|uniref:PPM-type phosphatase domain-containing protein n=1 Tax=Torulaspora globosa TaxID=48254 RepID=A0A7H9HRD9_9SACH|nr:hypothetical protein HG537_0B02530 [Torulaspora sp. CBS 2947]